MSLLGTVRENWRVTLLALLILASAFALAPGESADGPTSLSYGLELSGGTRVRAPLVGLTAEGVDVTPGNQEAIRETVADELEGVEVTDVAARLPARQGAGGTVEVFVADVTPEEFAAALRAAGLDVTADDVRPGVTEDTREVAVEVIRNKVDATGLSGGSVEQIETPTGQHFILIEVPNANRSEVVDLVESRGVVRIVAHYPVTEGNSTTYREETVLTQGDFRRPIPTARESPTLGPNVPVVVKPGVAQNMTETMVRTGFTGPGVSNCRYQQSPNDSGYCLYTVVDGEVVYAAGVRPDLAQSWESGEFVDRPTFAMTTRNMSEARELQIHLQAGDIPAPLDIEGRGSTTFIGPTVGQQNKLFSLVTGIIAVFAVAGVVFLRYGQPRVALPMVLTALSEVLLLLGFAAAVGLALDLSHIAGFIAVIGTGVDDLVIIADEVLSQGEVRTGRVFRSRFRKAFWVIGAAAITTIIAMTPLAYLSLGDLSGFAIVTIVGVLIGVLVTRPAYGDILRALMTER